MKKFTNILAIVLLAVMSLTVLTACSNISQAYADKINEAAAKEEYIEYLDVMNALGENAIDITIAKTGVIIAAQGCTSLEELNTKLEAGETVKGIVVTLFAGKALSAEYKVLSSEDTK